MAKFLISFLLFGSLFNAHSEADSSRDPHAVPSSAVQMDIVDHSTQAEAYLLTKRGPEAQKTVDLFVQMKHPDSDGGSNITQAELLNLTKTEEATVSPLLIFGVGYILGFIVCLGLAFLVFKQLRKNETRGASIQLPSTLNNEEKVGFLLSKLAWIRNHCHSAKSFKKIVNPISPDWNQSFQLDLIFKKYRIQLCMTRQGNWHTVELASDASELIQVSYLEDVGTLMNTDLQAFYRAQLTESEYDQLKRQIVELAANQ